MVQIRQHHQNLKYTITCERSHIIYYHICMQGSDIEQSPHLEIEEWKCTNLLLPAKLDKVHVFASKKVCIQKEYVIVRSEASPLVDNTISTGTH